MSKLNLFDRSGPISSQEASQIQCLVGGERVDIYFENQEMQVVVGSTSVTISGEGVRVERLDAENQR